VLVARSRHGGIVQVALHERQPWAGDTPGAADFQVAIALQGAERPGLSRLDRLRLGLAQ
jgi:hypothetical protein